MGKKYIKPNDPIITERKTSTGKTRRTTSQWDHQDLSHVRTRVMRGHNDAVKSVQFCDQDTKMLSASFDRSMILWNFDDGSSIYIYDGGHDARISQARMNRRADTIVSSGWDKKVNLWDALTGDIKWTGRHGGIVTCCNYSHDDQYVVSASDLDNIVKIWDVRDGKVALELKDLHEDTVTSVAFTSADDRLLTTSMDKTAKIYDLRAQCNTITLSGHSNVVSDASFTGDERKFATVSYDKSIRFYDVSTGTYRSDGPVVIDKAHEGCISAVDFSTDGLLLTTCGFDGAVCVWDVENYIMKLRLLGHVEWAEAVCFSTDQRWLLTGGKDSMVRLWNIEDSDAIPMVMEKKKAIGMKVFKCATCGKPFSQKMDEGEDFETDCDFCRASSDEKLREGAASPKKKKPSSPKKDGKEKKTEDAKPIKEEPSTSKYAVPKGPCTGFRM